MVQRLLRCYRELGLIASSAYWILLPLHGCGGSTAWDALSKFFCSQKMWWDLCSFKQEEKKKIELKRRSEEGQGCEAPSDNRVLEPGECQLLDQCSRGCTRKENFGPAITCLWGHCWLLRSAPGVQCSHLYRSRKRPQRNENFFSFSPSYPGTRSLFRACSCE